ncbi:MAG: hypothetical protein IJ960_09670 [Oscillospiraceae bacterium]|nr:hypothetical protein [Oscillospiraceae bacterium]
MKQGRVTLLGGLCLLAGTLLLLSGSLWALVLYFVGLGLLGSAAASVFQVILCRMDKEE